MAQQSLAAPVGAATVSMAPAEAAATAAKLWDTPLRAAFLDLELFESTGAGAYPFRAAEVIFAESTIELIRMIQRLAALCCLEFHLQQI